MKRLLHIFFVSAIVLSGACKKDKDQSTAPQGNGVYITNEGNFNFGNGEVSFYNADKQEVTNALFKTVNSYAPGDVVQSMFIKDSLGFIVVNNSQKIEVVKIPSFEKVRTITIPNSSPRYFMAVDDSIGYVTELYAGKIYMVNYITGAVVKQITGMHKWTEHMLRVGSNVLVEERNLSADHATTATIAVISMTTNSFVQRYSYTAGNSNGIVLDKLNHIWLAADEDSANAVAAHLYCLNSDMTVNKAIAFQAGHHSANLCINGAGDKLYFFDGDVRSMLIGDTAISYAPFITAGSRNLYGLGVDPFNGDVYVSDAKDYVQASDIYRYDVNGALINSFSAGIISGNFVFRHD